MMAPRRHHIFARVLALVLLTGIACSQHAPPQLQREQLSRRTPGESREEKEREGRAREFEGEQGQRRGQQDETPQPREHKLQHAGSFDGDLRSLPLNPVRRRERPEREGPEPRPVQLIDPDQPSAPNDPVSTGGGAQALSAPTPANNFEGLDFNNWGNGHPPDTNGDVGPTYYIQTINTAIGIYNKTTGVRVAAFTFDTFMSQGNFGNLCDTDNFGDPVALYDTFEDRWIITDFAFQLDGGDNVINPPGAFECFAVSKTGDPVAGGWNFYSINTTGGLGDYPKLGIWPDGVYMSVNMFDYAAAGSFQNVRLYALNKYQMYAGAPAVQVVSFDLPASEFTVLPANARLQTGTPPSGSPNYFASVWNYLNVVNVWKFHVDWNSISLSSLSGPFNSITATSWIQMSFASQGLVPSTGNSLDTLHPRLMMQNQYSNIGGVESIWNSHSVAQGPNGLANSRAAVRYYQVPVTGGTIANATQAFTYSPSTLNRFMPSVAVDRAGNMAIGYSASNASTNPAIRYAGRLAGDAVNSISQTETSMIEGGGSQTGNCGSGTCTRWGDYSAMSLDPDGCRFWYTNEYYALSGLNHHTRIGAFTLPGCTAIGVGSLQGTVKNSSLVPIAGATVQLGSRTTTTDGSGNYAFADLPAGTYPFVTASAPGFASSTVASIVVNQGITTTQNFVLSSAPLANCFVDTAQADFQTGVATNCDLTGTPGAVTLAKAFTLEQNVDVNVNGFGFTSTTWAGQTFTPQASGQLTKVELDLFCSGCTGTTPNITVSIRATSGGLPTGADLAVATIPGFSSGAGGFVTATLSAPVAVTAGTKYVVIVRAVSNPSAGTYAYVCSCAGNGFVDTNPYAAGQLVTSTNSGGVWAADNVVGGRDMKFIAYVETGFTATGNFVSSLKDANPPVGGTVSWGSITWNATVPAGTTVQLQVAASNNANGPFTFVGPFASGASLAQFNGFRYLKYKATLSTSNSANTPALTDVTVCFSNSVTTGPASVNPGSVTFAGKREVGTTSPPASPVTITNGGPNALIFNSFNGVAPSASFTVGTDFPATTNCPLTPSGLASGGSCQFTFSFAPQAAGNRNATLSIATNASNSPHSISLSGVAFVVDNATVTATLGAGAARLSQLQNPDGGWYFLASDTDCFGVSASCPNTIGVTGLGLLAAYKRTNNASTLADAVEAGNLLVSKYNAAPSNPPYSQDLEFLRALSNANSNPLYANTATAWFGAIMAAHPTGAARADWAFTDRDASGLRTLAVWDLSSTIRSAKAAGQTDYALSIANRIKQLESQWKDVNPAHRWDACSPGPCGPADNPYAFDYTLLGMGSFLWAVHDLPGFDTEITSYRAHLVAQQDSAGSWDVGDLQITAYSSLGLAAVGGTGVNTAIAKAISFYIANQLANNGWPFYVVGTSTGTEYSLVDSEVMRAVAGIFDTQQGKQIQVRPAQLATVEFENVSSIGSTTVVALDLAGSYALPFAHTLVPGLTYEVTTTASVGGGMVMCLNVPWQATAANFSNLRILHLEDGRFVDRTIMTGPNAPDAAAKRLCAAVSSLDAFAVALFDPTLADTVAPQLSVTLSPSVIMPARNQMVTVTATIAVSDNADPAPRIELVSITSNATNGNRSDVEGAAFGTDDRVFSLRADPSGRENRVYTVTYRATDASGNAATASFQIAVQK